MKTTMTNLMKTVTPAAGSPSIPRFRLDCSDFLPAVMDAFKPFSSQY